MKCEDKEKEFKSLIIDQEKYQKNISIEEFFKIYQKKSRKFFKILLK